MFCFPPSTPQGTTSNGTCLLPFKTGAFLAGLPVQPVIIKYGKVGWINTIELLLGLLA